MSPSPRQNNQGARCLDYIKRLPPTAEGVVLGLNMLGRDNFQSVLESSLHLQDGQHVAKWDAINTPQSLHFSCTSEGPAGRVYHDLFIDEKFRPFPEEVIYLLGKVAYSH